MYNYRAPCAVSLITFWVFNNGGWVHKYFLFFTFTYWGPTGRFEMDPVEKESVCLFVNPFNLTFLEIWSLLFFLTFQKFGCPYIMKSYDFRFFRKISISPRCLKLVPILPTNYFLHFSRNLFIILKLSRKLGTWICKKGDYFRFSGKFLFRLKA